MNKVEVAKTLGIIKVAYPNSFNKLTEPDKKAMLELWYRQFKDYDYIIVLNAIDSIIATDTSPFMPSIGTIKEHIYKLVNPNEITEIEAWQMVYKAICNSNHAREQFDNLPKVIQRLVGSPSQLIEWGRMDLDKVQSVISSNFQRSYRNALISDKEQSLLPNDVKQMIGGGTSATKQIE